MKKIFLGLIVAVGLVSCKKIQAGSNLGVLKLEDGTERYSDDAMMDTPPHIRDSAKAAAAVMAADSMTVSAPAAGTAKTDSATAKKNATDTEPLPRP